jgi:hypothetical protein
MIKPSQREAEMQGLKREVRFASSPKDEINGGTNMPIKDPDMMLSMTVLLFACLALAVLAHVIV